MTKGGLLEVTLDDLKDKSEIAFIDSLRQHVNNMLVRVEAPPRDLSPTTAITNLLALMRDILSTASMSEGRENDMAKVCLNYFSLFFTHLLINSLISSVIYCFIHYFKY